MPLLAPLPLPPAISLGQETSMTAPGLLEELLPFMEQPAGQLGTAGCALNLAKAILGAGVVAMPRAFLLCGALPASAAFLAVCALMLYSCACLASGARATGQLSYSGMLAAQLGPWAAAALDVSMVLDTFGLMVVLLIAAGDAAMPDPKWRGANLPWLRVLATSRPLVLSLITLLILAPLVSFRRLKQTTLVSVLGVAAISLWAAATCYLAAVVALKGRAHALMPWPAWQLLHESWQHAALQLAAVLPILVTAFLCQMSFFPVVSELDPPVTPRRMTRAAGIALALSLAITMVLSIGSELVFGDAIEHNVLSNFSLARIRELLSAEHVALAAGVAVVVRGAFLLSVCATFPLQMQPLRDSLMWLRHPHRSYSQLQAAEFQGWHFHALTYATLAAVCLVAVLLPSVWKPLQLIGATAGAMIAFILPGCLALSMQQWRLCSKAGAGALLLLVLGPLLAAAGIASVILH